MKVDVIYSNVFRPYACFTCRKSFKRRRIEFRAFPYARKNHLEFEAVVEALRPSLKYVCPQCRGPVFFMGVDFKPPKTSDRKGWQAAEAFIRSGNYYRHGRLPPELDRVHGIMFHEGRALIHAIRKAGLTLDDIPVMYRHQIPKFIDRLRHKTRPHE